jgi:hypothetical protein
MYYSVSVPPSLVVLSEMDLLWIFNYLRVLYDPMLIATPPSRFPHESHLNGSGVIKV